MNEPRAALAARVAGPVLAPGDDAYAAEVAGFNLALTPSPALVVGAGSTEDVAEAVRFGRERGLRVGVLATGHGETRGSAALLVTTRRMDGVAIDAGARTATVGGGATWAPVIAAAAPHGLAPSAGSSPLVGVTGYLLGGGLGPLARTQGFGSDHLLGATVVTGAGEVVEAGPGGDGELLWALRGGGGGVGVVTGARVRLLRFAFAGPDAEGEALTAPLRALAPAAHDGIGPWGSPTSSVSTTTPSIRRRRGCGACSCATPTWAWPT